MINNFKYRSREYTQIAKVNEVKLSINCDYKANPQ